MIIWDNKQAEFERDRYDSFCNLAPRFDKKSKEQPEKIFWTNLASTCRKQSEQLRIDLQNYFFSNGKPKD